jgi:outer membrane protein assembly factor BamB
MKPAALLAIATITLPAFATEKDWPEFRGKTGQGISTATNVPVKWSTTENVAWKVEVPGKGWSSPVVSAGKIYLTTAVGEPETGATLHALCFDEKDGRLIWNTEVFKANAGATSAIHKKNSLASPTPIATNDRLYVHFGHMGTAALDLTGKIVWKQTSLSYSPTHGNGGSPAVADGLLIFSADSNPDPVVIALDSATGTVRWKTPRDTQAKKKFSFSTPLVVGGEVISPGSGFVGGYDLKTGKEKWRAGYGEGYSVIPRPVVGDGMVFVSSSYDKASVKAVRLAGASGDVSESHVAWTLQKGAPHTPSMLVSGGNLFMVSDAGIANCVDTKTGDVRWTERLPGNYSASPVLAEGRIYFQSETGIGTVIKADEKFESLATNALDEPTLASPAIVDGAVIIRSENHLWKFGK